MLRCVASSPPKGFALNEYEYEDEVVDVGVLLSLFDGSVNSRSHSIWTAAG